MKLNTEEWKEFRIGDWFDQIGSTAIKKSFSKRSTPQDKFVIPALSSTVDNNSFGFYVKEEDHNLINRLCLSVTLNGDAGKVYVQNKAFAIAQDAYAIYLKDNVDVVDSEHIYLFLATAIEKSLIQKYGYTNKATWNKVKEELILLPSKNNEPDWDFMEKYIKEIEEKYIEKVDKYNQSNIQKALDITGIAEDELDKDLIIKPADRYEEFSVKSLFKLIPSQNYIDRNKISDVGRTKVYSSTTSDYGLMGYIYEDPYFLINEKNPYYIIFGDHTREFNFVYNSFSTTDNVKVLSPINKSKLTNLYILTLWKKHIPELGYSRHWSKAKNVVLKLPAIDEKTPDFEYMEKAIYIY